MLSPVVATAGIGLEGLLTERPGLAGGHESRILGNSYADGVTESIVLSQEVLTELLAQDGETAVDLRKAGLFLRIQADAVTDKAVIKLLGDHLLLPVQAGHVVIYRLHPGEETIVHENRIGSLRDDRGHFLLDLLDHRA